jgi:hypothetical protein
MKKLEQIFHAALQLENGPEREVFLSSACAGNDQLREQLDALLKADAAADDFFGSDPPQNNSNP